MTNRSMPRDPLWPRAGEWLQSVESLGASERPTADLGLLGVPAFRTSITPTGAHATPAAVRGALRRYSTWACTPSLDLSRLRAVDLGDVTDPDGPDGEARVSAASRASAGCRLLVAVGGDNSITFPLMLGLLGPDLSRCGLVTVDAHHDLRDGAANGSPVRRLIEAGLPGTRVAQIGIADFSNSPAYAARARESGITVFERSRLRSAGVNAIVEAALDVAGSDGGDVFVDLDVDVCDRSVAPGCHSSAPGGISADELRQIAFACGRDRRVRGIDVTEIDATADAADERTVRLGALLVLEAAAGLLARA